MAASLIIIYNHQFNKNIDTLETLYKHRFSSIFHLVPFYNGDKPNVIAVYENSFYFQNYVAQGFASFKNDAAEHYIFVGDDLLLHPSINENNYHQYFGLTSDKQNFIPGFISFHQTDPWWPRTYEAYHFSTKHAGLEVEKLLPSNEYATQKFTTAGLALQPLRFGQIWNVKSAKKWLRYISMDLLFPLKFLWATISHKKYNLPKPFVGAYSDVFVLHKNDIAQVVNYCGQLAACRLFVEVALPTALVWTTNQIATEKDTATKGKTMWKEEDFTFLKKYNQSLDALLADFPNALYIHPIKLSKWT
jgi:hypothetical protein